MTWVCYYNPFVHYVFVELAQGRNFIFLSGIQQIENSCKHGFPCMWIKFQNNLIIQIIKYRITFPHVTSCDQTQQEIIEALFHKENQLVNVMPLSEGENLSALSHLIVFRAINRS